MGSESESQRKSSTDADEARANGSLLGWLLLRGKRTRASAASSPEYGPDGARGVHGKRRNSPPPCPHAAAPCEDILPAAAAIGTDSFVTAPVSTCSESTLSRPASWSEATGGVVICARLHSASLDEQSNRADDESRRTLTVVHGICEAQGVAVGASVTASTTPIDIPLRLEEDEPDNPMVEAARQSLGEMEMRMSLSARAMRHGRRSSNQGRSREELLESARDGRTTASRAIGLTETTSDGVEGAGNSALSTPSSFWKSQPPTGHRSFEEPSPSDLCGAVSFQGYFADSVISRASPRRGGPPDLSEHSDEVGLGDLGGDDDLIFDLE